MLPFVTPVGFLTGVVAPPTNSVAPVVSGGKCIGLTFSTTTGTWTNSPSFTYQWQRGGVNIGGATAATYVMVAADVGAAITCNVTGTNGGGAATAASNSITGINWVTSVQTFSITIPSGSATATASISAVGALAYEEIGGFTCSNSSNSAPDSECPRIALTSSTQITATRGSATVGQTVTVTGTIVDPSTDLVESVERGTITLSAAANNTATLVTSVDTTRSAVRTLGFSTTEVSSSNTQWKGGVTLTNTNTVTANVNAAGSATTTFGYVVVQYKAQAIVRVQQVAAQFSSTVLAENDRAITSVNMANSIIAYGGNKCSSATFTNCQNYLQLTSTVNVGLFRSGTSSTSITPYYAVVEFITGVLKTSQRGAIVVDSVTSNTANLGTAVSTSRAVAHYTGNTASGTAPREVWGNVVLTSGSVVTAAKNTAGVTRSDVGYEVNEYN